MNYIRCSIHTVECASTTSAPKPTSLGSSFKEATPRPHYSSLAGGVRGRVDARRTPPDRSCTHVCVASRPVTEATRTDVCTCHVLVSGTMMELTDLSCLYYSYDAECVGWYEASSCEVQPSSGGHLVGGSASTRGVTQVTGCDVCP